MNTPIDTTQALTQMDSYLNQEKKLKDEIEQYEKLANSGDAHALRLVGRHKRMLAELQEAIKDLKQQQPINKKETSR